MTVDFNLHCLPDIDFNHGVQSAVNVVHNLKRCKIKYAVLTPTYDCDVDSVSSFVKSRRDKIKLIECSGVKLVPAANVIIKPGISDINDFAKLTVNKTNLIYLSLPDIFDETVFDREIHNIMYKHKLIPVFSDIDHYILTYTDDQLYKIFSVPYACYQFIISSLLNKEILKIARELIANGKCVLFGTGIRNYTNQNLNYNVPIKQFQKWFGKEYFNFYMLKCENLIK